MKMWIHTPWLRVFVLVSVTFASVFVNCTSYERSVKQSDVVAVIV